MTSSAAHYKLETDTTDHMSPSFITSSTFDPDAITLSFGADRGGKPQICMLYGTSYTQLGLLSPACVTNWPRVTGDGNFGTMWGPTDVQKAKFTLDLTDTVIDEQCSAEMACFIANIEAIDDKLLDFVYNNQLRVLGRKNLSRDEVKMLQIRQVRPKYDRNSSQLLGHTVQASTAKYGWDGMGGKVAKSINICDKTGRVIADANVCPGDVVAATMYVNQVYTGVGGDKFGVHWGFQDISIICQRSKLESKTHVSDFNSLAYTIGQEYTAPETSTFC